MRAIVTLVLFGSLLLSVPSHAQQDISLDVEDSWSFDVLAAVKVPVFWDVIHLAALDDGLDRHGVMMTLMNSFAQDRAIHSDRVQPRSGGELIKQTRQESAAVATALGGKSIGGDRHTVPADQMLEVMQVYPVAPDAPDFTLVIDVTHGSDIPIDGFISAPAGDPARLLTVETAVEAVTGQPTQSPVRETELIVAINEVGDSGVYGDATLTDNGNGTTTIDILVSGATGDHPAFLRNGTCEDLGGVIAPLTEVDPHGASATDVPFELSIIQDPHVGPHAVAIYRSADESSAVVACGDVPLVPVEPIQLIAAEVVEIVDARTLMVEIAGEEHIVVLIGVDPPSASECYGNLAEARLKRLVGVGTVVRLEADEVGKDAEGNLLRYVWIDRNDEQVLVNRELIEEGYAAFAPEPENGRYDEELAEAERSAIEGEKRIWSDCGGPHQPIAGAEPAASPVTAASTAVSARTQTLVAQAEPSDGLGVSRAAWDADHGRGEDMGLVAYENSRYLVLLWNNERIPGLSMSVGVPVSIAGAPTIQQLDIDGIGVHDRSHGDTLGRGRQAPGPEGGGSAMRQLRTDAGWHVHGLGPEIAFIDALGPFPRVEGGAVEDRLRLGTHGIEGTEQRRYQHTQDQEEPSHHATSSCAERRGHFTSA